MKTIPYWIDNTPFPEDIRGSEMPADVDVAVVGSGFTGLNAAIEMTKAGLDVAVFEKEKIGWGASSRNGGLMGSGLFVSADVMEAKYGKELAELFWQWSVRSIDYVEDLVTSGEIDCDFDRSGEIILACKPSHFASLVEYHEYLVNAYGDDNTEIIEPAELQGEIGSQIYYGGMLEKTGGGVDPAKYVFGLARLVTKYGGRLIENAEVTRIGRENGRFTLTTSKGKVKSQKILIATNGYTTNLIPKLRYGIFPGACYSIVTEPLSPEKQREISPNGRVFYDSRYFLNYFRVLADGRVLIGGTNTMVPGHSLDVSASELQERLIEIFPQLKNVEITHCWTGNLGLTFDRMPHVGCLGGIHYAYGFMGHGVTVGSYLGYEVGQIIAGQREKSIFEEIKHPRYFFSLLDGLYLPLVCAWFRFMDKIR